jgi:hypothetical protein
MARVFVGRGVADRVGQVDRGRAGLDRGLDDAAEKSIVVRVASSPTIRRPRPGCGPGHRHGDDLDHLLRGLAHLVLQMDRRGRDEGVDARLGGMAHRFAAASISF